MKEEQKVTKISAKLTNAKISPRKLIPVSRKIKGMRADKALSFLSFHNKKSAMLLAGVLKSAIDNAKNLHSFNPSNLEISGITLGKGIVRKAGRFAAKGRFMPVKKRTSIITVNISSIESQVSSKAEK